MTTVEIEDYLTKQLFISKDIVTYRSLSREFGIHVNVAKNALAAFHAKSTKSPEQTCSATYLVSGEITVLPTKADDEDMDVDYGFTPTPKANYGFAGSGEGQSDGEIVAQIQMTVVTEGGLEGAKAKYAKVTSVHVYSLSPSLIRDADLLCAPTRRVRELDNQKGVDLAKAVGRIIGDGIKMKEGGTKVKGRTTAIPSAQPTAPKLKAKPSTSGPSAAATKVEDKVKEEPKEEPKKPKQSGKLNFFAPKEQPSKNSGEAKTKAFFGGGVKSAAPSTKQTTPAQPRPAKEEKPQDTEPVKRGLKRKSVAPLISEEEEEETKSNTPVPPGPSSRRSSKPTSRRPSPQPTTAMSKLRLHKGAVLSEDESDEQPRKKILKRPRRKASVNSDNEGGYDPEAAKEAANALKSMMEMDDDQVEKVSRKAKVEILRQEEEEESEPEKEALPAQNRDKDMNISDDTETKQKQKPRKKKEKKVTPVGRNGLKKRRLMKSRMRTDEKGYMVTEDYSSYESVDEEEEEEVKKPAPKKKGNGGKRPVAGKEEECKEEPTNNDVEVPAPEDANANVATSSGDTKLKPTTKAASSSAKSATSRTGATAKGGRKQKTLNTFFGLPQAKK